MRRLTIPSKDPILSNKDARIVSVNFKTLEVTLNQTIRDLRIAVANDTAEPLKGAFKDYLTRMQDALEIVKNSRQDLINKDKVVIQEKNQKKSFNQNTEEIPLKEIIGRICAQLKTAQSCAEKIQKVIKEAGISEYNELGEAQAIIKDIITQLQKNSARSFSQEDNFIWDQLYRLEDAFGLAYMDLATLEDTSEDILETYASENTDRIITQTLELLEEVFSYLNDLKNKVSKLRKYFKHPYQSDLWESQWQVLHGNTSFSKLQYSYNRYKTSGRGRIEEAKVIIEDIIEELEINTYPEQYIATALQINKGIELTLRALKRICRI
jgi:hypothetical protein